MVSQPQNPEFRNNPDNFHPFRYVSIGIERKFLQICFVCLI